MAAYLYSNWPAQTTATARLEMLRLHIGEVAARMKPDVTSGSASVRRDAFVQYHRSLLEQLKDTQNEAAAERRGGLMVTRGRPV